MQTYRHTPTSEIDIVSEAFENVKIFLSQALDRTKLEGYEEGYNDATAEINLKNVGYKDKLIARTRAEVLEEFVEWYLLENRIWNFNKVDELRQQAKSYLTQKEGKHD